MRRVLAAALLTASVASAGEIQSPARQEPDRAHPAPAGAKGSFRYPLTQRSRVKSGSGAISLTLTQRRNLPIVAVVIMIPAANYVGASLLFPQAEGLANLTSDLLDENTESHDGDSFSRAFEALGASRSFFVVEHAAVVSVFAMKDAINSAVALVAEAIRHPSFRKEDLERFKAQSIANIKSGKSSPEGVSMGQMVRRVYGDRPDMRRATVESVSSITLDDVRKYHSMAYRPEGVSIHGAGDIGIEELKSLAEKNFAGWSAPTAEMARLKKLSGVPTPDKRAVAEGPGVIDLFDVPGAPQSIILVGQTALPLGHPDYYALRVLDVILGGSWGRLQRVLREEMRWAYGASSELNAGRLGGSFILRAPVQTDRTAESLFIMLAEMRRLREENITSAELQKIRNLADDGTVGAISTIQSLARIQADAEVLGLGDKSIAHNHDAFIKVTAADVRRVAQKYLRPESAAIVIAGDAARVKADLERLGPVRLIDADGKPLPPNGG